MKHTTSNLNLSQRTIVFLIDGSKVLLGYKKTGFGKGNYLGIGGKIEQAETEKHAAEREVLEEINVRNLILVKVADLTFLFPEKPTWSQQVHIFLSHKWEGKPEESNEIKPQWFDKNNLPLKKMWDDAHFWLPAILNGHTLKGTFTFNSELKVISAILKEHKFE